MVKTRIFAYIVTTILLFGAWTGVVLATETYPVNLGNFRCPKAPEANKKIAIFKLITPDHANGRTEFDDDGEETAHYSAGTHHPGVNDGRFFCVMIDQNRDSATWNDLLQGVDLVGQKIVPFGWGNEDVIRQFYVNGEWKNERRNGLTDANSEPDDNEVRYYFKQTCSSDFLYGCNASSGAEAPRVRYYFYGIPVDETGEQAFVYYMKIAEKDDYPAPDDPTASSTIPTPTQNSNSGSGNSGAGGGSSNLSQYAQRLNVLKVTDLPQLVGILIRGVLGIVGTIALVMIMYGGVLWMTARGNSETQTRAQNTIVWAALGIVLIFASYALVGFIFEIF